MKYLECIAKFKKFKNNNNHRFESIFNCWTFWSNTPKEKPPWTPLNFDFLQYQIRYSLASLTEPSLATFEVDPRFQTLPSNQRYVEVRPIEEGQSTAGISNPIIVAQICAVFNSPEKNCDREKLDGKEKIPWADEKKYPIRFQDLEKDWVRLSKNVKGDSPPPTLRLGNFRQSGDEFGAGSSKIFGNFFALCLTIICFLGAWIYTWY